MRVLHFFKTYFPDTMGGIEQVIYQLAEGGIRNGVQSDVLYLSSQNEMRDGILANHRVHRAHQNIYLASTGFSSGAFSMFKELCQSADIVHYHFPWPFMDMIHFMSAVKKPTLVSYHSDIVKQRLLLKLYTPLMKRFLKSVDAIVATSPNYLGSSEVLQEFRHKVTVIPIGIARMTYPAIEADRLLKWQAVVGNRFFLFIGALRYYKGLKYLLIAAQKTNFPVVIVGTGPLEKQLKKMGCDLKLSNLIFLGTLHDEDKFALLQLSYAVVLPSHLRSEAFGISLLEGAMFGKPLISSEIDTGTTYINVHNETGLVVPPGNPDALASAMRQLWYEPLLAARLGANALDRYERLFRADKMVDTYQILYESLLAGRG